MPRVLLHNNLFLRKKKTALLQSTDPCDVAATLDLSSGMRTFRTLFDLASDWLMGKWSVLIGREKRSRD